MPLFLLDQLSRHEWSDGGVMAEAGELYHLAFLYTPSSLFLQILDLAAIEHPSTMHIMLNVVSIDIYVNHLNPCLDLSKYLDIEILNLLREVF